MNRGSNFLKEVISKLEPTPIPQEELQDKPNQQNTELVNIPQKNVAIRKRQKNMYTRLIKLVPNIDMTHVYKFLGFIGINEHAVANQNYQQSFFKTFFYGRVITKVEIYNNAVLIQMESPMPSPYQPPIQYLIQKYKSFGNANFFELASIIEEVMGLFGGMDKETQSQEQKNESVKKCLDSLGNQMFVCALGLKKVAISKSLLNYLQYDVEQFALEAVKYRAIFTEFFSASCYAQGIVHIIKIFKHLTELNQNKISLSQFKQLTTMNFTDFIYSKTGVRSYVQMSLYLINPTFFCHKINFIYYKSDELGWSPQRNMYRQAAIEDEKQRVKQKQYGLIKKVKNIPSSLLKENYKKISGYRVVREEEKDQDVISEQKKSETKWKNNQIDEE